MHFELNKNMSSNTLSILNQLYKDVKIMILYNCFKALAITIRPSLQANNGCFSLHPRQEERL